MSRVAVVTGASGGIGGAAARALASDGAAVACCYHGDPAGAEKVAAGIEEAGGVAAAFRVDVRDEDGVRAVYREVTAWTDPPLVLVNAAGVVRDGLAVRYAAADLRHVLDVNLTGAFLMARAALRPMLRARWGRIVSVSSIAGLVGNPGQAAYSASKAGLHGMTRSLAREVGSRGITVNAVCPGLVDTSMTEEMPTQTLDRLVRSTPAGRRGHPDEVAAVIRFLAGEESGYVNGAVIPVDGGLSA